MGRKKTTNPKRAHDRKPVQVECLDPITLQPLKVYDSINEAARQLCVNPGNIHQAIAKGHNCAGYKWRKVA